MWEHGMIIPSNGGRGRIPPVGIVAATSCIAAASSASSQKARTRRGATARFHPDHPHAPHHPHPIESMPVPVVKSIPPSPIRP